MAQPQFRDLLKQNLSVAIYGVKDENTRIGTFHNDGTIFLDRETKKLYMSIVKVHPNHTIADLVPLGQMLEIPNIKDVDFPTGLETGVMDLEKEVVYDTPFPNLNYSLFITCYHSSGIMVGFQRTAKTPTGFKIIPSADCTIEYLAK